MKNATQYSQKLKQLLTQLKKQPVTAPAPSGEVGPMEVLLLAVMRRDASASQAAEALERVRAEFVDFNEMRAAPPRDLVEVFGRNMPEVRVKSDLLPQVLNHVFDHGNDMGLQYIETMAKRERRAHLREALGLDDYGAAFVELYLYDEPTVPVDDRLLARLQAEGYAPEGATTEEIRTVLDKLVSTKDAKVAFEALSAYGAESAPPLDQSDEEEPGEDAQAPAAKPAKRASAKKAKAPKVAKSAKSTQKPKSK